MPALLTLAPSLLCDKPGNVLCVRWSLDTGNFLASADDNKVIIIWTLSGGGPRKVFGSNEVSTENWALHKRLTGHTSDVVDLAWSPGNQYLASCSLDNYVIIWDGSTFRRILCSLSFPRIGLSKADFPFCRESEKAEWLHSHQRSYVGSCGRISCGAGCRH